MVYANTIQIDEHKTLGRFKSSTCPDVTYIDGERCIFKGQVDDFAIATKNGSTAHKVLEMTSFHS
jgi:hypothetical protein